MRLKLVIEVPDSATPPKVKQLIKQAVFTRKGITLNLPGGYLADVDVLAVREE